MSLRPFYSAAAAIAGVLAIVGCKPTTDKAAAVESPPILIGPESYFIAETRPVQSGPQVSGTLDAERAATIRAEVAGTITQASVDEGQRVVRGQVLGRISDASIGDVVLAAKSTLRVATEALTVAQRNAERAEKLAQAGAMADRELEQARWSVTTAEASLADANARVAGAEKQLGFTVIRAPFSGIVSERLVNAGDNVGIGNPLFAVVDPTSLRLEAQVPVGALGQLKIGTSVPFTVDGVGERNFQGRIIRISPTVDKATGQVKISVALPNTTGTLVSGLFAQGRVATVARDGIVVPNAAIDRRGVRPTVTRIERGIVRRIEIVIGIEDPTTDRIEISQGLAVGDTVLVGSARSIQPGTKARPSAPAERTKAAGN